MALLRRDFARIFLQAAAEVNARVSMDGFNSSVLYINDEDMPNFMRVLRSDLIREA